MKKELFENGIYISDQNIHIPWGSSFDEITKYGNPILDCTTKSNTKVKWNSVLILGFIKIDLWTFYLNCYSKRKPKGHFTVMYGEIDSSQIPRFKGVLESYSQYQGNLITHRKGFYTYWVIDECHVQVGYDKTNRAYVMIKKL